MTRSRRTLTSRAAAAREAGVTPMTVSGWISKGWLTEPPWTPHQVAKAAERSTRTGRRGSSSEHGTPSRWRAGCPCEKCAAAHRADDAARLRTRRMAEWAEREPGLLADLAAGTRYSEALARAEVTAQAVTEHRRRDPGFAERLDQALMAGRDPGLDHGRPIAWRSGCRCPECRAEHERGRG